MMVVERIQVYTLLKITEECSLFWSNSLCKTRSIGDMLLVKHRSMTLKISGYSLKLRLGFTGNV